VEDMLMGRIAQERPPLCPSAQRLGSERHAAPRGDQAADVEAPGGLEVIHHPGIVLHRGPLVDNRGQRGSQIGAGARRAQISHDLTWGDDKRGEQGPHPMPDGLVLTLLRFSRDHGLRRGLPLQNLHASLCIGADDHTTLLEAAQGMEI
jgi:hypothetical protein